MLELDRLEKTLEPCPLLIDVGSYFPDTVDLTQDESARDYWLQCFVESIEKVSVRSPCYDFPVLSPLQTLLRMRVLVVTGYIVLLDVIMLL